MYAGVAFAIAVIGAIVFATSRGPVNPQIGSSAALGGPGAQAGGSARALALPGTKRALLGHFRLDGRRGGLTVIISFYRGEQDWSWEIPSREQGFPRSGQYERTVGRGGHVEAGGHADDWYARLVGYIKAKGGQRQHVVIRIKGRPTGTFVLTPTKPGALKRDTGTHYSGFRG